MATCISVFRTTFTFEQAKSVVTKIDGESLWQVLCELQQLGFLFCGDADEAFDFHPILRSFLYDHLTNKKVVHQQAADYFQALPQVEKVITLEDMQPVIAA